MARLSDFRDRYQPAPYELELDDGSVISLAPPASLGAIMDLEDSLNGNIVEVLVALAGDQGEQLREALRGLPMGGLVPLRDDAYSHWGTGKSAS